MRKEMTYEEYCNMCLSEDMDCGPGQDEVECCVACGKWLDHNRKERLCNKCSDECDCEENNGY